jgi:threonine/homoserine/homoserine lactone efflux protein
MSFNLFGYLIYASLMSITPGPNNLMLLSYGKAYGFTYSKDVILGIFLGFFLMLCMAGYGIANIITRNPTASLVLKIVGSLWMLYLALLLRRLSVEVKPGEQATIGFGQAFFMQFVNLKAWIMAISGASAFLPQSNNIHLNVFVFAISFGLVGFPCMILWLKMGDVIAKMITSEKASQILGYTMFSLMIMSIVTIWIQ